MLKKQFIAGACCPGCKAQDTIVLIQTETQKRFECVSCGYVEIEGEPENVDPTASPESADNMIQWIKIDEN